MECIVEEFWVAEFDQEWDYGVPQGFGEEEEIFVEEEEQLQQPPKKKAKKREPYLAKCNICERPFKLMASLARHYGVHRMEDALRNSLPSVESVEAEANNYVDVLLAEWIAEVPTRGHGPGLKIALEEVQRDRCNPSFIRFIDRCVRNLCHCMPSGRHSPQVGKTDVPFPSELGTLFHMGINKIVNLNKITLQDLDFFTNLHKNAVKKIFLVGFLRRLSTKLLAFIIRSLKSSLKNPTAVTAVKSPADLLYCQEVAHFVGGSVVRRILRTALKLQDKHTKWEKVAEILKLKFLRIDFQLGPPEEVESWTRSQDKGSLLFISNAALEFFVCIGDIAEVCERPDGSLFASEVLEKIHDIPSTLHLWEQITSGDLSREDSQFIMDMACKLFCDTWGKGIVKRRLNAMHQKGFTSQAMRQRLAATSQ